MISVKVNKADPTDLYEQVAAKIRRAIADGEAKPGERLPPAKDLAAVLGVNTNTVLRSLRLLPRRGAARVPARAWHLGCRDAGTGRGRAASEGARGVRPPPGLPTGRAGRDHRERGLTKTRAQPPKYHGATLGHQTHRDGPRSRRSTIGRNASGKRDDLGCSRPAGFGPNFDLGRRFDSSRGCNLSSAVIRVDSGTGATCGDRHA